MKLKLIGLIVCLALLFVACTEQKTEKAMPPPPEISIVEIKAQDVPLFLEFVGEVSGLKDIAIRARVEGFLEGVHFQEGAEINKGDLLYTLESQPFEEKVATRMSALSISSVEAAEANLRASKIQLSYTKIKSPINGIIGKTQAKVGDFVGKDPNPVILNAVSQVDTILVTFFITESQYLAVARHLAQADSEEVENRQPNLELILIDGSVYDHKGRVDFVDRAVDTTTGAMLVQASFPNPEKLLRPGQFARVRVEVTKVKDGILIPQRCVMELQGLYNVFVVDAENKIVTREISAGPKVGSFWLIEKGLKPGEKVVYEGLQKVKVGMIVNPTVADPKSTDQEKE